MSCIWKTTDIQAFNIPIIQMKNEIAIAEPHLIPLETTNSSRRGKALNISVMLENIHPLKPTITIIDHISRSMSLISPEELKK